MSLKLAADDVRLTLIFMRFHGSALTEEKSFFLDEFFFINPCHRGLDALTNQLLHQLDREYLHFAPRSV